MKHKNQTYKDTHSSE